jgi:FAD/FMN-containing dehydrogenase
MTDGGTRREFIARLAGTAGGAIIGFDPDARSWATEARRGLVRLPRLDGTMVTNATVLDEVSQDNGRMISRRPIAVLRPGGVDDIVAMVRYANQNRLKIAMRGQGHSSFGQAQVEAGIVIDSRAIRRIRNVGPTRVTVDAGATWDEVLSATLPRGLTPPVLPDTQVLTVGGTLSVGGTGNASHRYGAIVDHVLNVIAVTGHGRATGGNERINRELFEMVLAGLGQCALITGADIALVKAPSEVTLVDYDHDDLDTFLDDQRAVAREGSFDHLGGRVATSAGGRATFRVTVGTFHGPGFPESNRPDNLRGARSQERRVPYRDYLNRTLALIERGKASGSWWWPSPSAMFFVPDSDARAFVTDALADPATLEGTELFGGFAFLACRTAPFTRPLFPFPDEPLAFQAWIIRRAPADRVDAVLAANLRLWQRVRAKGGTRYAGYGAVPFTPAHWAEHFGPATWKRLTTAKRTYDPGNVLTPGPGMF